MPKFRDNQEEMKKMDKLDPFAQANSLGHMLYGDMFWTVYRNDKGESKIVTITNLLYQKKFNQGS